MKEEIQKIIDQHLNPSRLEIEVANRFYDYFDEEDLQDGETELECINRYGSEEIPTDLINEIYDDLKENVEFDLFPPTETEETKEVNDYIKQKLRVVFTEYGKYEDFLKDRRNEINKLMLGFDDIDI